MIEIFGVANALAEKDKRIAELEAEIVSQDLLVAFTENVEAENAKLQAELDRQGFEFADREAELREAAQKVVDDAHYHVDLQSTPKEVATVASRLLDALAALLEGQE